MPCLQMTELNLSQAYERMVEKVCSQQYVNKRTGVVD